MAAEAPPSTDMGLDEGTPLREITLISNDGKSFKLPLKHAELSNLVRTSFETDKEGKELVLGEAKGHLLAKIVEYLEHHKGTDPGIPEKPLKSKVMKDAFPGHDWDCGFIDAIWEDRQLMYDLLAVSLSLSFVYPLSSSLSYTAPADGQLHGHQVPCPPLLCQSCVGHQAAAPRQDQGHPRSPPQEDRGEVRVNARVLDRNKL